MKIQDTSLIHPEDSSNFNYWTKKWRISDRQLNDAILNTGSLHPMDIRLYLRSRRRSLLRNLLHFLKPKSNALH